MCALFCILIIWNNIFGRFSEKLHVPFRFEHAHAHIDFTWLKLPSTKVLFNFHTSSMFAFDIFESSVVTANMDSKKTKFSPSSIDEAERTLMTRLTGSVDRYVVPEEFRGRTLTTWDHLAIACPPPGETTVQSYTQRWGFNRPVYDCFLPPNYSCICFKCQTLATVDIPYFHEIMD